MKTDDTLLVRMMTIKKPSKTTFFLTPLQSLQYFGFTSPKVYTLDSVEPEYLRECRGVHEKVHDRPPSTRLYIISVQYIAHISFQDSQHEYAHIQLKSVIKLIVGFSVGLSIGLHWITGYLTMTMSDDEVYSSDDEVCTKAPQLLTG